GPGQAEGSADEGSRAGRRKRWRAALLGGHRPGPRRARGRDGRLARHRLAAARPRNPLKAGRRWRVKAPGLMIGTCRIAPALGLAPMAGVTDKPFRLLCRRLGAGLATSEMTSSDPSLWHTRKSRERMDHCGEPGPVSVQIAGTVPERMA